VCVVVRVFFYVLCLYARERNFGEEKSKIFCKNPKKTERRIEERHPFLSERDERLGTFGDKKKSRLHAHGEKSTMSSREEEITRIHNEELLLQLFSLSLSSQNNPKNFFGFSSFALAFLFLLTIPFLLFFLASASLFACSIFFLRSSCILRISSGFISGPNPPKALMMVTFLLLLLLFFCFRCCC